MNKHHGFSIALSYRECTSLYQQSIKYVMVVDDIGKRIRIPKEHFRRFVTPEGLRGRFLLELDENNRFVDLSKTHD